MHARLASTGSPNLRLEVGIIGRRVALQPMRLQTVLGPDTRDHHVRDTEGFSQLTSALKRSGSSSASAL
jgi:hypothetical protein